MSAILSLATTATIWLAETGPSQEPVQKVPDSEVTPGWIGFLAIFFVGVATLFLIIDMVRRIRRTRYRAEIREQIAVERAEARAAAEGLDDELRDGGHHGPTSP